MASDSTTAYLVTIKDELAESYRWKFLPQAPPLSAWAWEKPGFPPQVQHPIPDTIDGIAKLMPQGLYVEIKQFSDGWYARVRHHFHKGLEITQMRTEYEARLRLLHLVLCTRFVHKEKT